MTLPLVERPPAPAVRTARAERSPWLFNRRIDSVLIANWWWPVIALAAAAGGWLNSGLTWWQLYFMSSPHRWITLPLVFGDTERVKAQWRRFAGVGLGLLAAGAVLLALGVSKNSGIAALTLFMSVDYAWNSWHFASQGAGISRIYGRTVAPDLDRRAIEREKSLFRMFVIFVFIRLAIVAGATSGQTRIDFDVQSLDRITRWGDFIAFAVAGVLLYRIARLSRPGQRAQLSYTGSFIALYAAQLVALHAHETGLAGYLAFAAAIFHASEYLAVCSWAASRKREGLWSRPRARSVGALVAFIVVVGALNWLLALWSL